MYTESVIIKNISGKSGFAIVADDNMKCKHWHSEITITNINWKLADKVCFDYIKIYSAKSFCTYDALYSKLIKYKTPKHNQKL